MQSPRSTKRWRSGPGLAALLLAVLTVWACDGLNLFSPGATAFGAPQIEIITPFDGEGVPLNDSLLVEVEVTDPDLRPASGLSRVLFEGVRFEGDVDLGTFEEFQRFQPKEVVFEEPQTGTTNLRRFLVPQPGGPSGFSYIRITAEDGSGNVTKDSVLVELGAPRVRILTPIDGEEVSQGSQMIIRAQATDPRGVVSIEITSPDGLPIVELPVSQAFDPAQDSVVLEQIVTLPSQTGTVDLSASAVNTDGIEGRVGPITVQITSQQVDDDVPPSLRVRVVPGGAVEDPRRVELTDTVEFLVEGRDNIGGSGVAQVGVTLQATPQRDPTATTVVPIATRNLSPPRTGTFTEVLKVGVDELQTLGVLDLLQAPDTIDLSFHGFMVDAQGNCAAAVSPDTFQSLTCGSLPSGETIAEATAGQTDFVVGVAGQTVTLPEAGSIADAVVDTVRGRLVLSNIELGQLEVFDLGTRTFETPIVVGSAPWGLTFHRTGPDTLFVANSGGTNISHVDVNQGREVLSRRILTPNTVLWQVNESEDEDGGTTFSAPEFFDFTDRPQFVAQDRNNHLVYSTLPTDAANSGTIRLGLRDLGPDTEVVLYTGHSAFVQADNTHAFGNVDDVNSIGDADAASGGGTNGTLDDAIQVIDHPVGDESTVLSTPLTDGSGESLSAAQTVSEMFALPGAYNEGTSNGAWDLAGVGLSDTTFVAASGDGAMVAIGEGATSPFGRVIVYQAPAAPASPEDHVGFVSSVIDVVDLFNNAAERVLGVALNEDATFGVARGIGAVSFFTPDDLRLQGTVAVEQGGAGVALHPLHSGDPVTTDPNVSLAFVPTGVRTIEVFDTRFFSRIGRVFVRQTVVGQIRATLPFPGDNAGLTCPTTTVAGKSVVQVFSDADGLVINGAVDRACTVLKLAAVTDDGGVVVVDVTVEDIVRDHPDS